jgi:hypothetical protein
MPVVPGHCLQVGVLPLSRLPEPLEGPAQQVRFSEGPACQVRRSPFDNPLRFGGHDERAPPTRPRLTCPSRGSRDLLVRAVSGRDPLVGAVEAPFDNPLRFSGRDRRAPPPSE